MRGDWWLGDIVLAAAMASLSRIPNRHAAWKQQELERGRWDDDGGVQPYEPGPRPWWSRQMRRAWERKHGVSK